MTLLFSEGAEYASQVQLASRWDSVPSAFVSSPAIGRRGGRALEVRSTGSAYISAAKTFSDTALNEYGVGFAVKQIDPSYGFIISFHSEYSIYDADRVAYFDYYPYDDANRLSFYDSTGSVVQTYTVDLFSYQFVEFFVDAATGSFKFYINEELVLDIVEYTTAPAKAFAISANHGAGSTTKINAYIDDLYIATERIGDIAVLYWPPTSDVDANFTPSTGTDNYALVDEIPEDDSDYVESAAVGDKDIYAHASNFGTLLGEVVEVGVVGFMNVPDGGVGSGIIPKLKVGETEYSGDQIDGTTVTKKNVFGSFLLNPATGDAFTQAEVEAITGFGWEIGS